MPKQKKRTKNTNLVEPYSRKGNNSGGDDIVEQLSCDKCSQCVENVIQCERCDHWYCCKCTGLPSSVMEIILLYKQLHWFCEACDKAATDAIVESTTNHTDGTLMCKEDVKDIVTQVGEAIKEAKECIRKTLVETLQGTVRSGSSGIDEEIEADNELNTSLSYCKATSNVITSFLDEEKERSKRRCNVILHNLNESSADTGQTRKEQDVANITSIFDKYMGVKPTIKNALRIGKKRDAGPGVRPRLLKVTLNSEHDKALLLRNCKKLRNQENPENIRSIYVTPDLTPREQQKGKALRVQLAEMNKGEKKYWIKNGRIVQRVD